jgi:hypothetical protein
MDRSNLNLSGIKAWLKLDVVFSIILHTGSMPRREALLKRSKHSGQKCNVEIDSCILECLRSPMKLEHVFIRDRGEYKQPNNDTILLLYCFKDSNTCNLTFWPFLRMDLPVALLTILVNFCFDLSDFLEAL